MKKWIFLVLTFGLIFLIVMPVSAAVTTYTSGYSDMDTTRQSWLNDLGISSPDKTIDFETGFSNGQDILGSVLSGGLTISSTAGNAYVTNNSDNLGGSYPLDTYALAVDEGNNYTFSFDSSISYFGFYMMDHNSTDITINYTDGTSEITAIDEGGSYGYDGIFLGLTFDKPVSSIYIPHVNGSDGEVGIDNIEFGESSTTTTRDVWDASVDGTSDTSRTTNYGTSPNLGGSPISTCNTAMNVAYIKFDLTSFPETVEKVNLVVEHLPHTTYCYSNCEADFYFYPVLEPWDEMTITYNNQPTLGTEPVYGPIHISFPNDLGQQKYDITDIYRQWKSGAIPNYGLGIYSPTVGCNNAAVMFRVASSENPDLPGPALEITSATEDLCSAANLQDCLDETSCTGVGGYWYNNACHDTSASSGLVANCSSAAPQEALPLVDFSTTTVNPTDNPMVVGARSEVTVQPTMQVPSADVGQTALLIMYIYLPDLEFGINIPAKTTTLSAETLCDLLSNPINLSTAAGLSLYVYYGYVIGANIKYTAYSVVVDPACVDNCRSITDATICSANPNCTYQEFPTAQCVWNCESYKTETACEEAFGGNVCGWNDMFSTCAPIQ